MKFFPNFVFLQVSPSSLSDNGVTVTRVVQKEGQFVIVFPDVRCTLLSTLKRFRCVGNL